MNENGNTWPPNQDPRLFQPPPGTRPPTGPAAPGPAAPGMQPPPGLQPPQPLHHDPRDRDPRLADPRRAADSPWRRIQRHSAPRGHRMAPRDRQP